MTKFAMVFPGQGSQIIGSLDKLAADNPIIKLTFKEASHVLGYDLWKLIKNGPAEKLNITSYAQPALLASSVAIYRLWQHRGGSMPSMMAGHSLGEYTALVCANVINFDDAIKLVELRGKLMQESVPNGSGAMRAIIGLKKEDVCRVCEEVARGQIVSPANFNAPNQVVISGNKEAVDRASIACKSAGAKRVISLPISVPSHCALMRPAAKKLAIELKKISFKTPVFPVINNVDIKCEIAPEAIRNALVRQLYNPVRWTEIIKFMRSCGIVMLLEIGPGKVLTGLTKHIIDTIVISAVNDPVSLELALKQ